MNLEQAKEIFTQGWNNHFQKPNPYKGKEAEIFESGEFARCSGWDFEQEFCAWRNRNGFPLTNAEQAAKYLSQVPEEFRSMLSYEAYDRGHSAGQEEIDSILSGLAYDFLQAWKKYQVRTSAKI
ncbi:MAG: hypothetical protein ACO29Q_04710 [Crocinitomicaceae bacterium]